MRLAGGRRVVASLLMLAAAVACTPALKTPGPAVRAPAMADEHLIMADGTRLPLRVWQPWQGDPRAVILALHGFNDYGTFIAEPAGWFAARGIAVYAYDQRGFGAAPDHGRWAGTDAYVDDLRTALGLVAARHPGVPVYVLGDSMGAAVAMVAQTGRPLDADGLILVAPAVWARQTMPFYQRWALWLGAHTVPWLTVSGRGLGIVPSDNLPMLRRLQRDPLVIKETRIDTIWGLVNLMDAAFAAAADLRGRVLILYGANDQIIRDGPTRAMLARLPDDPGAVADRRIAVYGGGYHMLLRDLAAETVWTDITRWIGDPAARLPSGADARARRYLAEGAASGGPAP